MWPRPISAGALWNRPTTINRPLRFYVSIWWGLIKDAECCTAALLAQGLRINAYCERTSWLSGSRKGSNNDCSEWHILCVDSPTNEQVITGLSKIRKTLCNNVEDGGWWEFRTQAQCLSRHMRLTGSARTRIRLTHCRPAFRSVLIVPRKRHRSLFAGCFS